MPIKAIDISTYKCPVLPLNVIDVDQVKKAAQAIILSTTVIAGVHAQSIDSESITTKSYIKAAAKDQRLNTDRVDLRMISKIRYIGTYTDGWDEANGKAASRQAVNEAEKFVWQLSPDIREPMITLAADGEINFLWDSPDFKLDLGIYGDGSYSYYGKTSNGAEFIADEKMIDDKLPDEILAFINHNNIN
ncbi:hypothetical protein [Methylobacter sp. sgz302048]|uniref:hypothetical protein n=1 Tax=Methylobacter sp. sgz302048 TaxID=3455945 RepID=UPI003FA04AA7